jgi:hypothetical protein
LPSPAAARAAPAHNNLIGTSSVLPDGHARRRCRLSLAPGSRARPPLPSRCRGHRALAPGAGVGGSCYVNRRAKAVTAAPQLDNDDMTSIHHTMRTKRRTISAWSASRSVRSAAIGPGCVKTHASGNCRKYNSPTRHPTVCPQHHLLDAKSRHRHLSRWADIIAKVTAGEAVE